jgi:hypothetical protein
MIPGEVIVVSQHLSQAELQAKANAVKARLQVARNQLRLAHEGVRRCRSALRRRKARVRVRSAAFRSLREQLALLDELMRDCGEPKAEIREPAPARTCVDWILSTLRANPRGITSEQVVAFLEGKIRTKQGRRRAILTGISHLKRAGRITLEDGLLRIPAQ